MASKARDHYSITFRRNKAQVSSTKHTELINQAYTYIFTNLLTIGTRQPLQRVAICQAFARLLSQLKNY
jgi:hypothetical protein